MPLYDFECLDCGEVRERVFSIAECPDETVCPSCAGLARKIISFGGGGIFREEAPWLKDAAAMADPDGGTHCQAFRNDPTRTNYHNWLQAEGLRPTDRSELRQQRKPKRDRKKFAEQLAKYRYDRRRVDL